MTLEIDFTAIMRRALNIAPRWAMMTIASGLVTGKAVQSFYIMFKPGIDLWFKDVGDFGAVSDIQWLVVGIALAFLFAWPWRIFQRSLRGGMSPTEKADEYISVMKHALTQAGSGPMEQKMYWNAVLQKLAQDFKIDVPPPFIDIVVENSQVAAQRNNSVDQNKK